MVPTDRDDTRPPLWLALVGLAVWVAPWVIAVARITEGKR